MRSFLSILAVVGTVVGTVWVAATYLPGEARADEVQSVSAAPTQAIQSISFDGQDLPLATLRAAIGTEVGGVVDDRQLDRDRRAIAEVLSERGYLAAAVETPSVTVTRAGAFVVFAVDHGPLFHVRAISLSGPGAREANVVTIESGDIALLDHLEIARATLDDSLQHRSVDLVTREDRANAVVDVELVVK